MFVNSCPVQCPPFLEAWWCLWVKEPVGVRLCSGAESAEPREEAGVDSGDHLEHPSAGVIQLGAGQLSKVLRQTINPLTGQPLVKLASQAQAAISPPAHLTNACSLQVSINANDNANVNANTHYLTSSSLFRQSNRPLDIFIHHRDPQEN